MNNILTWRTSASNMSPLQEVKNFKKCSMYGCDVSFMHNFKVFCKNHRCHYDKCIKCALPSNEYCKKHKTGQVEKIKTCAIYECNVTFQHNFKIFCKNHRCHHDRCTKSALSNIEFCEIHTNHIKNFKTCLLHECNIKFEDESKIYCENHCCHHDGCKKLALTKNEFCFEHKKNQWYGCSII